MNYYKQLVRSDIKPATGNAYRREGEAIISASAEAWYYHACYWRDRAEKAEAKLKDATLETKEPPLEPQPARKPKPKPQPPSPIRLPVPTRGGK